MKHEQMGCVYTRSTLARSTPTRSTLTRSTLTRSTFHEINFHEINSSFWSGATARSQIHHMKEKRIQTLWPLQHRRLDLEQIPSSHQAPY